MWDYRAAATKVLDGDTVRLIVDLGFYAHHRVDLRLLDVYAPELRDPGGPEATVFVERWLASVPNVSRAWPLHVTTQTTLVTEPSERMTFTRYVGTIAALGVEDIPSLNDDLRVYLAGGT